MSFAKNARENTFVLSIETIVKPFAMLPTIPRPTLMPSLLEDFFKPWSQWFDDGGLVGRVANLPAVNIKDNGTQFILSLAAPGLNKEDFRIDVENKRLTISAEKETTAEEKEDTFTRKEYAYESFSRSFVLPDEVKEDAIEARYENGELKITLPRKEGAKATAATKLIAVQ